MQHLCLIVSAERGFTERMRAELPSRGFRVHAAESADEVPTMLRQWRFDSVLLDDSVCQGDCPQVVRRLLAHCRAPLVVLAEGHDEGEQIRALEAGATDVLVKPASARFIGAKLRRLIEVGREADDGDSTACLRLGGLILDSRRGTATVGGQALRLTHNEFELLWLLGRRIGQFVDRDTIAVALHGTPVGTGRSADVHVYRIRKKLREHRLDSLRLETIYGRGYCLTLEGGEPDAFGWARPVDPSGPYRSRAA